jgi:hypothetical protein
MAVTHNIVSIGTTATVISTAANDRDGHSVLVQNPSASTTVYIGGAGVTTTSYGVALAGGADMSIDLLQGEILYGVVTSSTQNVNVLRAGN